MSLFFLYLFRIAAIAVYILCGWFTDNYVLSVRIPTFKIRPTIEFLFVVDRCCGSPLSYGLLELPSEHAHEHTPFLARSSVYFPNRTFQDEHWLDFASGIKYGPSRFPPPHLFFQLFSLGRRRWRELLGI